MSIKCSHILGAIFTLIVGTLLHFTYEWSHQNAFIGFFSAINESTWEHLKLLAIPMLLYTLVEYFIYGKQLANYVPVKLLSIILGMLLFTASFFTYVGIIGKHVLWIDIVIFISGILLAHWFSYKSLQKDFLSSKCANLIARISMILLIACFMIFTFYPPDIALFRVPSNLE